MLARAHTPTVIWSGVPTGMPGWTTDRHLRASPKGTPRPDKLMTCTRSKSTSSASHSSRSADWARLGFLTSTELKVGVLGAPGEVRTGNEQESVVYRNELRVVSDLVAVEDFVRSTIAGFKCTATSSVVGDDARRRPPSAASVSM